MKTESELERGVCEGASGLDELLGAASPVTAAAMRTHPGALCRVAPPLFSDHVQFEVGRQ